MSLFPCNKCNRKFTYDRLEIHENICRGQNKVSTVTSNQKYSDYDTEAPPSGTGLQRDFEGSGGSYESPRMVNKPTNPGKGLVCEICGRLYGTQSLAIHQVKCRQKQDAEKKDLEERRKFENRKVTSAMPGVICYICGRRYGTISINIHEEQCLEKWHVQNNQLPKNQRRKPPVKPDFDKSILQSRVNEEKLKGSGAYNLDDAYNDAMVAASKQNMEQCGNCGRRFNPESLTIHLRSCKSKKSSQFNTT